jgi:HAD superfamily hydrolase (TIGR01484 family)
MIIPQPSGILALDIDGTLTAETYSIPLPVQQLLHAWYTHGWKVIFITGRPFQWSHLTLQTLPFPYALAVQNGASLLEMPAQSLIASRLLDQTILHPLQAICRQAQTGFAVYGGYQVDDWCYYILSDFSQELRSYIQRRNEKLGEKWHALESWDQLPITHFASTKCFAKEALALELSQTIEKSLHLHAPPNRDPFDRNYFVVQATHPQATKGAVLRDFKQSLWIEGLKVVAAGDDYNDQSLLEEADIKIVMANAPPELLKIATIVAPPASAMGLLQGLKEANKLLKGKIND